MTSEYGRAYSREALNISSEECGLELAAPKKPEPKTKASYMQVIPLHLDSGRQVTVKYALTDNPFGSFDAWVELSMGGRRKVYKNGKRVQGEQIESDDIIAGIRGLPGQIRRCIEDAYVRQVSAASNNGTVRREFDVWDEKTGNARVSYSDSGGGLERIVEIRLGEDEPRLYVDGVRMSGGRMLNDAQTTLLSRLPEYVKSGIQEMLEKGLAKERIPDRL